STRVRGPNVAGVRLRTRWRNREPGPDARGPEATAEGGVADRSAQDYPRAGPRQCAGKPRCGLAEPGSEENVLGECTFAPIRHKASRSASRLPHGSATLGLEAL